MNVRECVRPEILALAEYEAAPAGGVRLDTNESPWPAPVNNNAINRYPSRIPRDLIARMAAYYEVGENAVLPTRGSDDAIDALIRCFCEPAKDAVLITPPTFGMYTTFARIHGASTIEIPLRDDFSLPLNGLLAVRDGVKLVFLCSPNNPTGRAVSNEAIAAICTAWTERAIVVVDEAYAEFMQQPSATSLLSRFKNLVVLRTLSKGLALAGARVGALLGAPDVIEFAPKVLPPYLLPSPSVSVAAAALTPAALKTARSRIVRVLRERDRVAAALSTNPEVRRVYPSDANFIFADFFDAAGVVERLQEVHIRVRAFSDARITNCLRIGIGAPAENDALLSALETVDA